MPAASWLEWTEREALARRLEALAPHFGARHDFDVWRAGVLGAFIAGGIACVGTPEGALLLQGGEGLWAVIATLGELDQDDVRASFAALPEDTRLVVWDEEVGPDWVAWLEDAGVKPYVRQTYVQDLAHVEFRPVPDGGIRLEPFGESVRGEDALELLAMGNAYGLEGMFLTLPKPPTLVNCRAAIARMRAGEHGEVLPWASFVATHGDRLVGTLVCLQGEHAHQGVLFDLYVDPVARGRGLSRRLVAAMQGALLARGYRENRFLTMGDNAPVHQLFRDEEILSIEETRGGYWQPA